MALWQALVAALAQLDAEVARIGDERLTAATRGVEQALRMMVRRERDG